MRYLISIIFLTFFLISCNTNYENNRKDKDSLKDKEESFKQLKDEDKISDYVQHSCKWF